MDILQEVTATKKFLQSIGLMGDKSDSESELTEKSQDVVEHVLKQYKIKFRKKHKTASAGHIYEYHFSFEDKKFVVIASLQVPNKHLTVSIWSEDKSHFYKVLGSSDIKYFYPLRSHMMDQMGQFLSGEYA